MAKRFWNRRSLISMLLVAIALISVGYVLAQDQGPDISLITRYGGLAFERTEDGGFQLGNPDAPVTIVEFSDFMCPHCQEYEDTIERFISDYVVTGKARFEYRMFPIVNPVYSPLTAQVAECADTLQAGMFWPARYLLFELAINQQITQDVASVVANRLGLDAQALADCVPNAAQYTIDTDLAQEMGVSGTPSIMARQDDGELGWITIDGQAFSRGGPSYQVLQQFMEGGDNVTTSPPNRVLNDKLLHDTSLVTGEPCAAPCWDNITPGETSWDDALAIIEADSAFTNLQSQAQSNGSAVAVWQPIDGQLCCQFYSEAGQTVDVILLQTAPDMKLGDVIKAHGEPKYIVGTEVSSKQAVMNLLYPDVPMLIYVFVTGAATGELTESSEIIGVLYLTPTTMQELIKSSSLYDWQGYQSYQAYAEGTLAVTPEP